MKLFDIYSKVIGSKASFLNGFQNNDELYAQAQSFWSKLESNAYIFLALFLLLGFGLSLYYYKPFNNRPGRHYQPKYWWIGMAICFVATLLITLLAAYLIAEPKLTGSLGLELKLSLINGLYAVILYFVTSFIYCNGGFTTNAYRYLKL